MNLTKASAKLVVWSAFVFVFVTKAFSGLDYKTIDTVKLHSMIVDNAYELEGGREKKFIVVDARPRKEYDEAHIFSAISIPEDDFNESVKLLPQDKRVLLIVYCNATHDDISRKWAGKAEDAGYRKIVIYEEGFLAWKEKKMPIAPLIGI